MAKFIDPFPGVVGDVVSNDDIINAIRLDIASEYEAIMSYDAQARRATNPNVRKVFESIRDEEKVHVGELTRLLHMMTNDGGYFDEGHEEADELLSKEGVEDSVDNGNGELGDIIDELIDEE